MPGARNTRRCSYVDGDKRCRRNGFGNPPICRQHAAMLAAGLEAPAGDPLVDLLGDGDRWTSRQRDPLIAAAAGIVGVVLSGILTGRYQQPRDPFPFGPLGPQVGAVFGANHPFSRAAAGTPPPNGGRRHPRPPPPRPSDPPPPDPIQRAREVLNFEPAEPLTRELINARRRALATLYHPDRQGGSTTAMQRINQAADLLLAKVA